MYLVRDSAILWKVGLMDHNFIIVFMFGSADQWKPNTSPNDPVFFLNHCNVDRIWALWQDLRYNRDYPDDGTIVDRNCKKINHYNLNDKIYPWHDELDSKTVADVLDYRALDYTYEK